MTPQPARIAHYTISAKLGEGGMGAVYRATDTKLNCDVAIKLLPRHSRKDGSRVAYVCSGDLWVYTFATRLYPVVNRRQALLANSAYAAASYASARRTPFTGQRLGARSWRG